jgi:hypothetical protein
MLSKAKEDVFKVTSKEDQGYEKDVTNNTFGGLCNFNDGFI